MLTTNVAHKSEHGVVQSISKLKDCDSTVIIEMMEMMLKISYL